MLKILVFSESITAYNQYLDFLNNLLPTKILNVEFVSNETKINGWPEDTTVVIFIDEARSEGQRRLRTLARERYKRIRYLEQRSILIRCRPK